MKFRKENLARIALLLVLVIPAFAFALPEGENVVSGSATFDRSQANTLSVNTPSERLIVNYNSFNIAQPEAVSFLQPSASSIVLNRVVGVDPSSIMGRLSANGRVFIVNPNGVIFGPNSRVDVASLVASSLNISNDDFSNGNYVFSKSGKNGYVINQGTLKALSGGYICLLGGAVDNRLAIQADLGTVVLASGEKITLALENDRAISVVVNEAVRSEVFGPDGNKITSAIKNSGTILAGGGKVILTAKVLNKVFDQAINNTGLVKVTSLVKHDGVIELMAEGAPIVNSGTLEAETVYIKVSNSGITNTPEGKIIAQVSPTALVGGKIFMEAASILQQGVISANVDQGTAGQIDMISNNNIVLDENSRTEARATGISGNGGKININSKQGSVFVKKNAKIDFSAGSIAGNGGLFKVDAFQQLGFYGILNGRAPPGFTPGIALLDPEYATISGTIATYTTVTVDAWRDITIVGNVLIGFNATLNLYADHLYIPEQQNPYIWDNTYNPGIGAIINTGNYTISGSDNGGTLNLRAGSGIGSLDHPVLTNVSTLSATINPSSPQGDIYLEQGNAMLNFVEISTPYLAVLMSTGQINDGDITADELYIESQNGIGSHQSNIEMSVNSLAAVNGSKYADGSTSGTNGILINNDKNLVILAAVNYANEGETRVNISTYPAGDIRVRYGIWANDSITLSAYGNIILNTIANIVAPQTATVTLTAYSGSISRRNMEVLDYGLRAYWNFDQSSSYYYATDVSGNGYSAYCSGNPEIRTGMYGQALYFDGVNDYINLGRNFNFGTGPFTLIAWYQGTQSLNNVGLMGASPSPYTTGFAFETHYGALQSWINNDMDRSTFAINDNIWHQVAMVRDGTEGSLYVFNDDNKYATNFDVPAGSVDTAANFWIGGWGHLKRLTQGNLDDVRVYGSALSGLEIYGQTLVAPGTGEISAGTVILSATASVPYTGNSSIGTLSAPILTAAQVLSATNNGTGDIFISNRGNLQLGRVDPYWPLSGIFNYRGNIDVRAINNLNTSSDLTINDEVRALNGGSVYLSATQDIIINDGMVYADADSESAAVTSGSVTLNAGRDIVVNGGWIYSGAESTYGGGSATAGLVSLTAYRDVILRDGIDFWASVSSFANARPDVGNAYANSGAVGITAYYGDISVTGDSQIYSEASASTGDGDTYAYAGSISLNAGGTIDLNSSYDGSPIYSSAFAQYTAPYGTAVDGDITLSGYYGVTLNNYLDCNNLTITSYGGPVAIGTAETGTQLVSTTGNIFIYGYGRVDLYDSITAGDISILSGYDYLAIHDYAYGDIIASGSMTLYGYRDIDILNTLSAASFDITSETGIIVTPVGADIIANGGDVTLHAGNYIVINGNLTANDLTATTDYGHITIDVGDGQLITTGDVYIEAGLYNGGDDITIAQNLNAQDITLYGSMISTRSLVASGDVDVQGGMITINGNVSGYTINLSSLYSLTVAPLYEGYTGISALNNVTIQAESDIVLYADIYCEDGDISINSDSGSITIYSGEGGVDAAGNVDITAWGNIGLDSNVSAGGDLIVESMAGSLTGPATHAIYLIGQHMRITAANDFTLNTGDGILRLSSDAFTASLSHNGEDWPLGLTLTATGGRTISVDADLEFSEDLVLTSDGDLSVEEYAYITARNITLNSLNGDVTLNNSLDAGQNINVTASTGNIVVAIAEGGISAAGDIRFEAAGNIEVTSEMSAVNIFLLADCHRDEEGIRYSDGMGYLAIYSYYAGIIASGNMDLEAGEDITINNSLEAVDLTVISSDGNIVFDVTEGDISATGDIRFEAAGNIDVLSGMDGDNIYLYAGCYRDYYGDLNFYDTGYLTIDAGLTASGIMDLEAGGDISIGGLAATGLTVISHYGAVSSNSEYGDILIDGDVAISASGDIELYSRLHSGNINVTSYNGNILLSAGENILFATGDVRFEAAGNIDILSGIEGNDIYLLAGFYRDAYGEPQSNGTGALTINAVYADVTASGDMDLEAGGDITINSGLETQDLTIISNNGAVTIEGYYGDITTEGDVTIEADDNIELHNSLAAVNVNLTSHNGDIVFDVEAGSFYATGDVLINAGADVTIANDLEAQDITIRGSMITTESLIASTGDVDVQGGMIAISGDVSGNWITLDSDSSLTVQPGDGYASISAVNDLIIQAANNIDINADISSEEGNISINSDNGSITIDPIEGAVEASGDVDVTAWGNIGLYGDVIAGGELTIESTAGSLTSPEAYMISLAAPHMYITAANDFTLNFNEGGLRLTSAAFSAGLTDTTYEENPLSLSLTATGTHTITVAAALDFIEDFVLSCGGLLTVAEAAEISAGNIDFTSFGGGMLIGGDLSAAGYIDLASFGDMELQNVSAGTNLDIVTDAGDVTAGSLTATEGYVYIDANGSVTVNDLIFAGEDITINAYGEILEVHGMDAGTYIHAYSNGGDMRINGDLQTENEDSNIYLHSANDMYIYGDMYAPAIDLQPSGNLYGDGEVTLYGQNFSFGSIGDFIINGDTVSRGNFSAVLNGADYPLRNLTIESRDGSITVSGPFERGNYSIVQLYARSGIILNAPITMGLESSLYIVSNNGSIIAGELQGPHITSAGYVYLYNGYSETMIGSEQFPLDVLITGAGSLNLDCYGAIEGVSGWLSGTIREITTPNAVTVYNAPGLVYFNGVAVGVEPEPQPIEENPVAPLGNIMSYQPDPTNADILINYQMSSSIGPVFLYHPLTETDMGAFDGLSLGADAYQLRDGQLQLIGHDSLLQFFQEFDKKKK